ncbi:serine protease inhibitor, serpin, putative [Entamoeba invadens IP1]|uniref:Serine protease inhibitor, serpin, putative n=1 Tax=Entamoeba invadens IP1 TaxID=370355 RepID=A0A0A1U6M7_ENTIV|nr:serine protease inhibitor, serpin, putative [Entamoeba invadens IP1]ELP87471.1 serine protease inhibitor, serpin, putative [Entamoeba invadens IP1]|eukprot:XP_004254242.1 serine protease inhibitor, serpin, putative [Entamoeba invadens IP1]
MSLDWHYIAPLQEALYKICVDWYTTSTSLDDLVYSTHSMFLAFAMLYIGSVGSTKKELEKVFGYSKLPADKFLSILTTLIYTEDGEVSPLLVANGIWANKDFVLKESYIESVKKMNCTINSVDFRKDVESVRKVINLFVEENTKNVIQDFIQEGVITSDTLSVLVNAIYFEGKWATPFDVLPDKMKFKIGGQNLRDSKPETQYAIALKSEVRSSAQFREKYTSVSIPYTSADYSMVFIVPNDMTSFEKEGGINELKDIVISTVQSFPQKRNVTIPKFEIESSFAMNDQLGKLGLKDSFTQNADFSNMSNNKLSVSAAIHRAKVKVDEKGTIAAAATGIMMMRAMIVEEAKDVVVDSPFYFVIVGKHNLPIFFGKITHPITK